MSIATRDLTHRYMYIYVDINNRIYLFEEILKMQKNTFSYDNIKI